MRARFRGIQRFQRVKVGCGSLCGEQQNGSVLDKVLQIKCTQPYYRFVDEKHLNFKEFEMSVIDLMLWHLHS